MNPRTRPWLGWLWALGAALVVFGARSSQVHFYAGDIPLLDQWSVESGGLLEPWTRGEFSLAELFRPHNEHIPTLTRLLALAETLVSGQWDPRLQMAVNAALHAAFVALVVHWLGTVLPWRRAALAGAFATLVASLPFAWENITWGFQSQFPLALLFLFIHVRGAFTARPGTRDWWFAQAAGALGFLTLGSMWTAPLAVVLVAWWTQSPARLFTVPLVLALVSGAILLGLGLAGALGASSVLHARTLPGFLHAWFIQLGWPGATVLLQLPLVLLALQVRDRRETSALDRIVLALGVWSVLQAAGIAFARGGGWVGFVSRYGDLFAVGLVANFLAALRLQPPSRPLRWVPAAFTLLWLVPAGHGLYTICVASHTRGFHDHAAARAARNRAAVDAFLRDGRREHLADPAIQDGLYADTDFLVKMLSTPGIRGLLPAPDRLSAAGRAARTLQARWAWLGGLGLVLFAGGVAALRRTAPATAPALRLERDPWRTALPAGLAVAATAALFLWPRPFVFGEFARKLRVVQAPGTIVPLRYEFAAPHALHPDRIVGAAALEPGDLRNIFRGTHLDGARDHAVIRSETFVLVTPFLIVPFAGDPRAGGMALDVQVEDAQGAVVATYRCAEPAPTTGLGFWEFDCRAHQGRTARLVLRDDSPTAWLAAASPQYAWKPGQGARRTEAWAAEQTAAAHDALGLVALLGAAGAAWGLAARLRARD